MTVIDMAAYRGKAKPEDGASRDAQRERERGVEADDLLRRLSKIPRIPAGDRPVLARNLGRLIERLELTARLKTAEKVLDTCWPKRKRYVRFADEDAKPSSHYAASGPTFAGIIERLKKEKERKGFDSTQVKIEVVLEALKGTSFRPASRFRTNESVGDAAILATSMQKVCESLARQVDLDEYFQTVSKFPIYPVNPASPNWPSGGVLEFVSERDPNRLYKWDQFVDDDQIQTWIPWWAPKCVIGHLYVPFSCKCLRVPKQSASEIKKMCGGLINEDTWRREECSWEIEFPKSEMIPSRHMLHRLPVLLVVLPSMSGLVPCLCATVHHWDDFRIRQSLKNRCYREYTNAITPSFVRTVGERIENDAVFFVDDETEYKNLTYVCVEDDFIDLIGWLVDQGVENFENVCARPASLVAGPSRAETVKTHCGFGRGQWLHPRPAGYS
jgi:hypothetical protein